MMNQSVIGKKVVSPTTPAEDNQEINAASPPGPADYQYLMLRLELSQKKDKKPVNREPLPRLVKRALARLHQEDEYLRIIPKCDWPREYTPLNYDGKKRLQIDGNKVPTDPKSFDGYFEYSNNEVHPYETRKIVVRCRVKTTKAFKDLKSAQVRQYLEARAQYLNHSNFRSLEEATVGFYSELHTKFANFIDLEFELRKKMQKPTKRINEEEDQEGNAGKTMNDSEESDLYVPAFTVGFRKIITGLGENTCSTFAVAIRCEATHKQELNAILQETSIHCGTYCPYSVTKHAKVERAVKLQTRFMENTKMIKLLGFTYKGLLQKFHHNGRATSVARELVANGILGIHRPTDPTRKCIYLVCEKAKQAEVAEYIDALILQVNSLPEETRNKIVMTDWNPRRSVQRDKSHLDSYYDNLSGKTGYWKSDVSTVPSKPKNAWNRPPTIIMHQDDQRSGSPVSTMAESQKSTVTIEEVSQIVKESNAALEKKLRQEHEQQISSLKQEFDEKLEQERQRQIKREQKQDEQHLAIMTMFKWMKNEKDKKKLSRTRRRIFDDSEDDGHENDDSNGDDEHNDENNHADDNMDNENNDDNFDEGFDTNDQNNNGSNQQQQQNKENHMSTDGVDQTDEAAAQDFSFGDHAEHQQPHSGSTSLPEDATIIFNPDDSPSKLSISTIRSEYDNETALIPRDPNRADVTPTTRHQHHNYSAPPHGIDRSLGSQESRHYLFPLGSSGTPEKRVRFFPQQELEKYHQYRQDNGLPSEPDPRAHQPPYFHAQPTQYMQSYYGHHHPKHGHPHPPVPYYPPPAILQAEHLFYQQNQAPAMAPPPPDGIPIPTFQPLTQSPATYEQQHLPMPMPPGNQQFSTPPSAEYPHDAHAHPAANQQPQPATEQDLSIKTKSNQSIPTALKQGDGGDYHE